MAVDGDEAGVARGDLGREGVKEVLEAVVNTFPFSLI